MPRPLRKDVLIQIFGSPSAEYALAVCLRLQRMKGRTNPQAVPIPFNRKRCRGRNYHHMTPRFRRGELYYGTTQGNMLLIWIPRHEAWHDAFLLQTFEETIAMLRSCIRNQREHIFIMETFLALHVAQRARQVHRMKKKWERYRLNMSG